MKCIAVLKAFTGVCIGNIRISECLCFDKGLKTNFIKIKKAFNIEVFEVMWENEQFKMIISKAFEH